MQKYKNAKIPKVLKCKNARNTKMQKYQKYKNAKVHKYKIYKNEKNQKWQKHINILPITYFKRKSYSMILLIHNLIY